MTQESKNKFKIFFLLLINIFLLIITFLSCELSLNVPERNNPNDSEADNFFGKKKVKMISPFWNEKLTDFTPVFFWKKLGKAIYYELQVDNNKEFSSPEINIKKINDTQYAHHEPIAYGYNYIRIRAINKGSVKSQWSVKLFNFSGPEVNLVSPLNNNTLQGLVPVISWNDIDITNSYELQIDNDNDFSSPEINITGLKTTNYKLNKQLIYGKYNLRIRAVKNRKITSNWHKIKFILKSPSINMIKPKQDGTITGFTTTFSWNAVDKTTNYELQVDNNSDFSSPEIKVTGLKTTNYKHNTQLLYGKHYLRIRAVSNKIFSKWNNINFTLKSPIVKIDQPKKDEIINELIPIISWNALDNAETYRIQIDNDLDFSSPEINSENIPKTYFKLSQKIIPGNNYIRLKAINSKSYESKWCQPRKIIIDFKPENLYPLDQWVISINNPVISWDSIDGADTYHLQVSKNNNCSSPFINIISLKNNFYKLTPGSLTEGETYYWRIKAHNFNGISSLWSKVKTNLYNKYGIGVKGEAGGIIFYDKGSYSDGWRYLEVAPLDTKAELQWGGRGIVTGTSSRQIGSGFTNTKNTITFLDSVGISSDYAAKYCDELEINGYNDWYLPSYDELRNLPKVHYNLGIIEYGRYWSSTEFDNYYARTIYFSKNNNYYYSSYKHSKSDSKYVIAIR